MIKVGTSINKKNLYFVLFLLLSLSACAAHPITITPLETPERKENSLNAKKVAYLITNEERNKQVTTEGGGGDKVTYYPYRDLEKAIREALRAVYSDVFAIDSIYNNPIVKENDISFIFSPEIYTNSNSDSAFKWPPTTFSIELSCYVTDSTGKPITRIKVLGNCAVEFSEFNRDFGLAGRRAATEVSKKLVREIIANPNLK
jgi:hypothetical protein